MTGDKGSSQDTGFRCYLHGICPLSCLLLSILVYYSPVTLALTISSCLHAVARLAMLRVVQAAPINRGITIMKALASLIIALLLPFSALAQTPAPAVPPVATDITAEDIQSFIANLPRDRVSDLPIRVVEVTGNYRIGVFGVFRPQSMPGGSNLHPVNTTEIYYMLTGSGVLVTGGSMTDPQPAPAPSLSIRGSGIAGGVSRQVKAGDVVIIPGHTPHWFSSLDSDITYLIYRPDPDNRLDLK